jgi:hypothetical protein
LNKPASTKSLVYLLGETLNDKILEIYPIGKEQSIVHGTIHGPGYSGDKGIGSSFTLQGRRFGDDFHVYAVEYVSGVDGNLYAFGLPKNCLTMQHGYTITDFRRPELGGETGTAR